MLLMKVNMYGLLKGTMNLRLFLNPLLTIRTLEHYMKLDCSYLAVPFLPLNNDIPSYLTSKSSSSGTFIQLLGSFQFTKSN